MLQDTKMFAKFKLDFVNLDLKKKKKRHLGALFSLSQDGRVL